MTPSARTVVHERRVRAGDPGEPHARLGLGRGHTDLVAEQRDDAVGPDLVQLVDLAEHGDGVLDAQPTVEALGEQPVVHPHQHGREPEVDVQPFEGGERDQRQLDVEVRGQRPRVDDVDVGLGELAVATLLRPLAAPHLLDLVAAEREGELVGVLEHVARERHGEVEVQPQLGRAARLGGDALHRVDLLVDLTLLGQRVQRLDRAGLDRGEAVQLEDLAQPVEDLLLDDALLGGQLGEPGQRAGAAHASEPPRPSR